MYTGPRGGISPVQARKLTSTTVSTKTQLGYVS
jgi:hypothetical protein